MYKRQPLAQWEELIKKVNSLNRFKKKNNDFIRRFTAGVKFIELDGNGRLLIPKDLIEFSNINRDVTLSTSVNIIEIWDKSGFIPYFDYVNRSGEGNIPINI